MYVRRVYWAICTEGKEIGYLRKGENELFHKKGMWDSPPVCLKSILKEHMEKYFWPSSGFKEGIYDKFADGKGLCVCYE